MWGLGILITLIICVVIIIKWFTSSTKPKTLKVGILVAVASYPFLHYLYPSYHQFTSLCEAEDRKIIYRNSSVDYLYLGDGSMCNNGFEYLAKYKGVECNWSPKENDERGNHKGLFRYIRGENWSADSCTKGCLSQPNYTIKNQCLHSCMQLVKIKKITNHYTRTNSYKALMPNRLYVSESKVVDERGIIAATKNYTYYPYANTWAKILGAASGEAPSKKCAARLYVDKLEIYIPNKISR